MNVAIFSESSIDDAALRLLIDTLYGTPTEPVPLTLRSRGWPILPLLPAVIKHLHFHTDADALVAVVDSDNTPLHSPDHESTPMPECRLCAIRQAINVTLSHLPTRNHKPTLRVAIGIASPAIEAWLLAKENSGINENTWSRGLQSGEPPYTTAQLKLWARQAVPPNTNPSEHHVIQLMKEAISRIEHLERSFPIGLGSLASAIRGWHA